MDSGLSSVRNLLYIVLVLALLSVLQISTSARS